MNQTENENSPPIPLPITIAAGGGIGMVEAAVLHPLTIMKTRKQLRLPSTFALQTLYKGFCMQVASTMPMDAVQIATAIYLTQRVFKNHDRNFKRLFASGYLGGVAGGVIISPIENILVQQQLGRCGRTPFDTARLIYQRHGISGLYRGVGGTTQRVGLFCAGFYAGIPTASKYLQFHYNSPPLVADFLSGISLGALTALMSHVPDTIKTTQQAELDKACGFIDASRKIYKGDGMLGFMRGFPERGTRITISCALMAYLTKTFEETYQKNILYANTEVASEKNSSNSLHLPAFSDKISQNTSCQSLTLSEKNLSSNAAAHTLGSASKTALAAGLAAVVEPVLSYPGLGYKYSQQMKHNIFASPRKLSPQQLIRELYRGLFSFQASSVPSIVLQRLFLDSVGGDSEKDKHLILLKSIASGVVSASIACPVERIIIAQKSLQANIRTSVLAMLRMQGMRGLWRGYILTAAREGGCAGAVWGLSPLLQKILTAHNSYELSSTTILLTASIAAGIFASSLTHPFDTIKTRYQEAQTIKSTQHITMRETFVAIKQQGGTASFFKGFSGRATSLTLSVLLLPELNERFSKALGTK